MALVTSNQFWSKGFLFCCFAPLTILTVLQMLAENWIAAVWQAVILAILCVNNYLLCSNCTLKEELLEQLQVNLALIEHIKENLNEESEEKK